MTLAQARRRPVALVTGASRGIGRSTALALAEAGYDVAVTGRTLVEGSGTVPARTAAEGGQTFSVPGSLDTTRAAIEARGVCALPVRMDLGDLDSVRAAARTVHEQWGPVDVLVNNAINHLPHARLLELDPADLRASLEANHVHQVALVQAVLPPMLEAGGGTIVDLCSGSATTDPPGPPGEGGWGVAYSSAKVAFGRLAGAINAEYRDRGVRAFNVDPGFVVTESGAARGGVAAIAAEGFDTAAEEDAGRAIRWLADDPASERFLGKVVWAPRLAAEISEAG